MHVHTPVSTKPVAVGLSDGVLLEGKLEGNLPYFCLFNHFRNVELKQPVIFVTGLFYSRFCLLQMQMSAWL